MIPRDLSQTLASLLRQYPVVTVTGPRQSGKTTLCQACLPNLPYVNLEAPDERAFAQDDPRGFLGRFPQGAILDEIQHVPKPIWLSHCRRVLSTGVRLPARPIRRRANACG
jgi:predicted AAA+ superfamily ATPase